MDKATVETLARIAELADEDGLLEDILSRIMTEKVLTAEDVLREYRARLNEILNIAQDALLVPVKNE